MPKCRLSRSEPPPRIPNPSQHLSTPPNTNSDFVRFLLISQILAHFLVCSSLILGELLKYMNSIIEIWANTRILLKIRYLAQKRIMVDIFDFARFSQLSKIWMQMPIFFSVN